MSDTLSEASSTADAATSVSLALSNALKVVGQRCVLFDRPVRANIRRVAVWDTGLREHRAFSAGRMGSGRSTRANRLLACGLGEHEVVDLFYRDITPEDYDLLLRLDEMVPKRTAKAENISHLRQRAPSERQHEVCGVCLVQFEDNDVVLAVSCPAKHEFHRRCITKWLTECSKTCPIDHAELPEMLSAR